MAPSPALEVNFAALGQLASRMDNIHSVFSSMGAHPPVDELALGDSRLVGELEHFLSGWSQGRDQITQQLGAVTKAVQNALAIYGKAEQDILSVEGGGGAAL